MSTGKSPNIVVMMSDDHAQWASHCYGNSELRTPNMDYLAESGVQMQNAFTPTPVCSPARASFLTGRLPCQHGIHDVIRTTPEFDFGWLEGETILPELLKRRDYQTGHFGKWHCTASSLEPKPGYDRWVGFGNEASSYWNVYLHRGRVNFSDQGENIWKEGYQTQFLVDQAREFLEGRDQSRPFFVFLGLVNTHVPFENQPSRYVDEYRKVHFWDIPKGESSYLRPITPVPEGHEEFLAQYYSAVSMIDDQIGILMDFLEGEGELENTLFVYTSDHGHMNGHHGLYYKGSATMPQNFFEESIRVPCLMRWPEGLPAGVRLENPFDHCDLHQSILEAAGVSLTTEERRRFNSPGESLLSFLRNSEAEWRPYHFGEYGNARLVSDSKRKLVRHYAPHAGGFPDEFIDLKNDPRETTNLIDDPSREKEIVELSEVLEEHFARYEDPKRSAKNMASQPPCNPTEAWRNPLGEKAPGLP